MTGSADNGQARKVRVHIYIYICVCVCIYICVCVCVVGECIYIYIYIYINYVCRNVGMNICNFAFKSACSDICVYALIHFRCIHV